MGNILQLVDSTYVIVSGTVKQVGAESVWITQANTGIDICLSSAMDIRESFLPGHAVRCVVINSAGESRLIKAVNQTTHRTIAAIPERCPQIPGLPKLGLLALISPNAITGVAMFIPLLNWLVAIIYLFIAIAQAQQVRYGWEHLGKGVLAFVGGLILLPWAPTIGLMVGLGLMDRQMLRDVNEMHDRADASLAAAPALTST